MSVRSAALLVACVFIVSGPAALSQEWTRFRGPNGTGVSDCTTIPVEWTESDFNWKTPLPGVGHSSPVVWGDQVFLISADPKTATRYVLSIDASSGKELWRKEYPSQTHTLHTRSSYASSTPAVDEERVYVGWSTPEETLLKALTHDGKEVWSNDLGTWQSQHGFGTSPIVFKDMVILHNSQQANQLDPGQKPGESYMMAFDRKTGDERWRTPLKSMNVCYSVPMIRKSENGTDELICTSTGNGVFSLDPMTGMENWSFNPDLFEMRTVSSPVEAAGLIFGSNGSGQYSSNYVVAVKPGPDAEMPYKRFANGPDFKAPYVPCLIANGDLVFCLYDRGFASCIDAGSGEVLWTERTGADFSGSPVRVNDRIYAIAEDGTVWVFAASDEYKVLAKNPLGEPSRSTPAVANGRMYLRTESHLISVGGEG